MPFTRYQSFQTLAELQPAQIFLQSYEAERLPESLDIYFGPPEEFFIAPDTQELYTRGRLVPILDDGNFGVVTFYHPGTRELIQIDVELPEKAVASFRHWRQYLADLMVRVGEFVEDDNRVRRIATIVEFPRVEELFVFFRNVVDMPDGDYAAARQRFVNGSL